MLTTASATSPRHAETRFGFGAGPGPEDGREEETRSTLLLLDKTIVKERLTLLHQEIDDVAASLAARTGTGIAGIPDEMDGRLTKIVSDHKEAFASPRQQAMFMEAAGPLLASARARAAELRERRARAYQDTVIGRQNDFLMDRAVSDENIFNDAMQTDFRDVILFNVETLHAALPQAERAQKVDAAARDLYRAVLDRRIALRPESAADILRSAAVRRALGNSEAREYDGRAAAAIAARRAIISARDWMAAGLSPAEAGEKAKEQGDGGTAALAEYRRLKTDQDEKSALAHLLPVREAWEALATAGYRIDTSAPGGGTAAPGAAALPASPALASLVRELLDDWLTNGGRPPEPDYVQFLRYMALPRQQLWAELADEGRAYEFVRSLGGPAGPAFAVAARRLAAASTAEDAALAADLAAARDGVLRLHPAGEAEGGPPQDNPGENNSPRDVPEQGSPGAECDPAESGRPAPGRAELNRFLAAVQRDRRVRLARQQGGAEQSGGGELLAGELAEIVRMCAGMVKSKTPLARGE